MNAAERRRLEEALRDHPAWQRIILPHILAVRKSHADALLHSLTDPAQIAAARAARGALKGVLEMAGYVMQDDAPSVPGSKADDEE